MSAPRDEVAVLGGGLAGIAAAVRLADAGRAVTLVETSRRLGGRATSHEDPATGLLVDNCQHVLLGCCTNLLDLYRRLGVEDAIRWDTELHFFDKRGHHDVLRRGPLPAPLHLALSMRRFTTLSRTDRRCINRAMLAMLRMGTAGRAAVEDMTFERWLVDRGQTRDAIDRFWAVVIVSALNEMPQRASAAAAIQVFQEGFLAHRDAYKMGTAMVALRNLYDPAGAIVERAGGSLRLGTSVEAIEVSGDRAIAVRLAGGDVLRPAAVVSALPFDRLARVIGDDAAATDARFASLDRFEHSPILGIHLWMSRPVVPWPHMIFVDSPLQWVFNKGAVDAAGAERGGATREGAAQYLHGVISAARDWVDEPAERVIDMAVAELSAYTGEPAGPALQRARVIKEKRATYSIVPGLAAARPSTRGAIRNLMLAGDWTDTGWPATMEGAVRSGYRAAAAAIGGDDREALVADLPPARLVRWLAR